MTTVPASLAVALLAAALVTINYEAGQQGRADHTSDPLVEHHAFSQVLLQLPAVALRKVQQDVHEFDPSASLPCREEQEAEERHRHGLRARLASLLSAQWHRWTPTSELRREGIMDFFYSAVLFDWGIFIAAVALAVFLRVYLVDGLSARAYYGIGLVCWLAMGAIYNACIWVRLGEETGVNWLAGYVLEFVFLIENIFVFQVVVHAFNVPEHLICRVLQVVVCGQVLFEMVFFMGLAVTLRSLSFLPFVLGAWLILCGASAACETDHTHFDVMDSSVVRALRYVLGDRLELNFGSKDEGSMLLRDEHGWRISVLGLATCVLLAVDFFLEVDVVLTKIEEFSSAYIAFSSSAVAAFSIPELYFLSQGALNRFPELQYGIGIVLGIFGVQMLVSSVYVLRPWVSCVVVLAILLGCVIFSSIRQCCGRLRQNCSEEASAEQAEN